jgi:hypothetical protein
LKQRLAAAEVTAQLERGLRTRLEEDIRRMLLKNMTSMNVEAIAALNQPLLYPDQDAKEDDILRMVDHGFQLPISTINTLVDEHNTPKASGTNTVGVDNLENKFDNSISSEPIESDLISPKPSRMSTLQDITPRQTIPVPTPTQAVRVKNIRKSTSSQSKEGVVKANSGKKSTES